MVGVQDVQLGVLVSDQVEASCPFVLRINRDEGVPEVNEEPSNGGNVIQSIHTMCQEQWDPNSLQMIIMKFSGTLISLESIPERWVIFSTCQWLRIQDVVLGFQIRSLGEYQKAMIAAWIGQWTQLKMNHKTFKLGTLSNSLNEGLITPIVDGQDGKPADSQSAQSAAE